ncbi:MAG: hypothetical protein IJ635_06050 [Bacteroidaceae bacterium]|nr:hypothetical protein [Bacteroidaceae bacterium]
MTIGKKMFVTVMAIFLVYAVVFLVFEDYDRHVLDPLNEASDWYLLLFSLLVMLIVGYVLHRYSRRLDDTISRQQSEEQNKMRRQLTQNISHELKTPVASILGYTDTILDTPNLPPDTQRQFIERTNAQARRLTALLQDLSTLNRMDYAPEMLSKERVDVSALVADIVQETSLAFQRKSMTLKNELPEGIHVQGNWSLLYSVFRNLFDNALHHAGEGTTVELSAEQQKDTWEFTFSDNGQGVAPEHLPRLFERFYRIDKGRSRSMGGTGLGLSIVKNAVLWHGGTIRVQQNPGGGLRFAFTLPFHSVE